MPSAVQLSFDPDDVGCVSAVAAADLVLAHAQLHLQHEALQRKYAAHKAQLRDARAATTRLEMQVAAAALDHRKALAGEQGQREQGALELAALHREFGRREEWGRACSATVDELLREQRRDFLRELDAHEARVGAVRVQHTAELSELAARNATLQRDLAAVQAALAAATAAANLRAAAAARGLPVGVQTDDALWSLPSSAAPSASATAPRSGAGSGTNLGRTMGTEREPSDAAAAAAGPRDVPPLAQSFRHSVPASADASRCDLAALATSNHDVTATMLPPPPRSQPQPLLHPAAAAGPAAPSSRPARGQHHHHHNQPHHHHTQAGGDATAPGTPMSQASSLARLQQVYQRAPTLASIGLGPSGSGWVDASTQSLVPLNAAAVVADQSLQSLRPLGAVMFDYYHEPQPHADDPLHHQHVDRREAVGFSEEPSAALYHHQHPNHSRPQPPVQQQQLAMPIAAATTRRGSTDSSRVVNAANALHTYRADSSGIAGVDDASLYSYHSFF